MPKIAGIPDAKRPLTDTAIRKLAPPPEGTTETHSDPGTPGLFLVCKGASKKWVFRFTSPTTKKRNLAGGGTYPAVALADARAWARSQAAIVAAGQDPVAVKREKAARALTFEAVAREWFSRRKGDRDERTKTGILQRLRAHVFPVIGARPITAVTRAELTAMLTALEKPTKTRNGTRGGPEVARRTRGIVAEVLEYACDAGHLSANPSPSPKIFRPNVRGHHAAVEAVDLPRLLAAIAANHANARAPTRTALSLCILLWQRPNEIVGMRASELDLGRAVWNIPAARMKMNRDQRVPLPSQAVALLHEQAQWAVNDCVFPSPAATGHLTTAAVLQLLRGLGFETETVHGFRALARTTLAQAPFSYPEAVLEAQLAHAKKGAVAAAYDRADFLEERREVLQRWADHLESLRPGWLPL
jgi:integrase